MRGLLRALLLALAATVLAPIAAYAQASITGVVKDTSGAVLPGVTVEVSSPALIEKARSTVTDGSGLYQIISLPPGAYAVTFTLTGFNTVKREGVELAGSFIATINGEMKVGAVAETITVTGETPLVDVQSAAVQKVVTKEVVDAIPTGRLGINLAALQPGIILGAAGGVGVANSNSLATQDVGGTAGDSFTDLAIHGGKPAEQRQTIGGVSAATTIRFGESLSSSPSFTAMQEMALNTSGADATMAGGGVQMAYVPRDGGNTFKGLMFASGATGGMQGTNYTTGSGVGAACTPIESLFCRGLLPGPGGSQPGALVHVYDYNPGFGGPIMKDKLWFFATARWTEAVNQVLNDYPNANYTLGVTNPRLLNATTMAYVPNTSAPLDQTWGGGGHFWEQTVRLSWQASEKNKFGAYYNNKKREYTNGVTTTSHEALPTTYFFPFSDNLLQWSSPRTNRLLLDAAFWRHQETWGNRMADSSITDPLSVGITDLAPVSSVPGYTQLINNYHGHVGATDTASHNPNYRGNFNVSYVTGSHTFKTGVDVNGAFRWALSQAVLPYSYVVSTLPNNGVGAGIPVPVGLMLNTYGCTDPLSRVVSGQVVGGATSIQPGCPVDTVGSPNRVRTEGGTYVQDKWTLNRMTLQAGVRLDWFYSQNPAFHLYPSLVTPLRNYDVPEFSTTQYKDITPKVGMSYDLFGDGKTAIKANISKYVLGQALVLGGLASQAGYNIATATTGVGRSWTDNNKNGVPDCDLTNPAAQGPTLGGSLAQIDSCGAVTGANALIYANTLNPNLAVQNDARYGWGKRPYSWEFSVSAQHELGRGISINGGVFKRWFGNFLVTDDLNHPANTYTQYSINPAGIPAPGASAGGATLPAGLYTSGFYNVNDTLAANNLTGLSDSMYPGSNVYDHWFGFDLGTSMRLPHGIIFQGGLSTGHQTTDYCDVIDPAKAGPNAALNMLSGLNVLGATSSVSACHMDQKWLPQVKFLGSYTVPKIDVQLGAAYQSIPGVEMFANYAAPNAVIQQSLGRLPTGGIATGTTALSLLPPGQNYYTRFNQIDLRLGKIIRLARTRSNLSLDIYNITNSDVLSGISSTYVTWLAPTSVVAPRLLKVSWTFDF
jgi:hypothetical protein